MVGPSKDIDVLTGWLDVGPINLLCQNPSPGYGQYLHATARFVQP